MRGVALSKDARLGAPQTGTARPSSSISAERTSPKPCMSVICGPPFSATRFSGSIARRLDCRQRRPSGRLGAADGAAHLGNRASRDRADLFRSRLHRPLSGTIAGDDGRSGRDLSDAPRPPAKPMRRGSKRSAPRHRRIASRASRLSRTVAAFRQRLEVRARARISTAWACTSICGRAKPASMPDRPDDRGPEGASGIAIRARARWSSRSSGTPTRRRCRR